MVALRLGVAGAVLLLSGYWWGSTEVEARGGACGSVWSHEPVRIEELTDDSGVHYLDRPEGCGPAREHRRNAVALVMIPGAVALMVGGAEGLSKPSRRPVGGQYPPRPRTVQAPPRPPLSPGNAPFDPGVPPSGPNPEV
ncbi:hypothetical protein [Kitasatospora sp. NPDC101183]|uniref:hypothetical protein n=1 Tax=Kitasatospora sp. NPDC101183 TaxID=3364100 RepID=UPI00381B7BEE